MIKFIAVVITVMFAAVIGFQAGQLPYAKPQITNTINASPGGSVFDFIEKYNGINIRNEKLIINGPCMSACTYFLNLVEPDRVCATDHASFWFHGIYGGILGFNAPMVEVIHPMVYPQFVIDLLKEKGFDGSKDVDKTVNHIGLIPLTREELHINAC